MDEGEGAVWASAVPGPHNAAVKATIPSVLIIFIFLCE
jgi:hypothetical protein